MTRTSSDRMLATLVIVVLLAGSHVSAQQERERKSEQREARKEARKELRTWFTTSVYPRLKQLHDAYDAQLSASDRSTLEQLRKEARQARLRLEDGLTKIIAAPRRERRDLADDVRDEYRDAMKSIIDRVRPVAKSSRTFLRDMMDKNEEQFDAWRKEAQRIMESHRGDDDRGGDRKRGKRGGHPLLGDGRMAALRFILWDGSLEQALNDDTGDQEGRR